MILIKDLEDSVDQVLGQLDARSHVDGPRKLLWDNKNRQPSEKWKVNPLRRKQIPGELHAVFNDSDWELTELSVFEGDKLFSEKQILTS